MSEHVTRQTFSTLKKAIDALVSVPELFHAGDLHFGQQLAFLPFESWPPEYFHRAWQLLMVHTKELEGLNISSQELPEPPQFPGRNRYISRHPDEGWLLVFPKEAWEVSDTLRSFPASEYVSKPVPHWVVYPIQGAGKALLDFARQHRFQIAPGVKASAQDADLRPCPLVSRRILLALDPDEHPIGFDLYFPRSAELLRQVKEEIIGRTFIEEPPHWQTPATPYAGQAVLNIALQHQFSVDPAAAPLLQELTEEAALLPPRPPVRRIEYDATTKRFWLYFPWQKADFEEVRDGIAGSKFEKNRHGPRWGIPSTNVKGIRGLISFLERHPEFSCPMEVQSVLRNLRMAADRLLLASKSQEGASLSLTGLGGTLRPFQVAVVAYARQVNYRILIGDDVGVGKTPEALAILHQTQAFPAVILVPASLKWNWHTEVTIWLPGRSVRVLDGERSQPGDYDAEITIINYDLLSARLSDMQAAFAAVGGLKGIIADESDFLKEPDALRTKAALALAQGVPVRAALSGTVVPNRPVELVSQLIFLDQLENFGGFFPYVKRYCGARLTEHGWDFTGASNTSELYEQLRATCYIRRTLDEVHPDLPLITREMVRIEIDNRDEYERAERELITWLREQVGQDQQFLVELEGLSAEDRKRAIARRETVVEQQARKAEQLRRIEVLKQLAVRGKIHAVRSFIEEILARGEKLVIYASHIEVQRQLLDWFPDAAHVLGDQGAKERYANVTRFQSDPKCTLIVCSLLAAMTGYTLTAANKIAIIELGWNPRALQQPEGRIRRMTQQSTTLMAYYLLAARTIENPILHLIEEKQKVIASISDGIEYDEEKQSVFGPLLKLLIEEGTEYTKREDPSPLLSTRGLR